MLFDKLYVASELRMTLWPCACADEMRPLERRLWVQFFRLVKGARNALDHEQTASLMQRIVTAREAVRERHDGP